MVNIARIRYVTTHFNVLKGLAIIPWGIYYLLGAVCAAWRASSLNDATRFGGLLGGIFLAGLAQILLLVYYQKTAGFVGNPTQTSQTSFRAGIQRKQRWLWIGFVLGTTLVEVFALWVTHLIDAQFFSMFIFRLLLAIAFCLFCCALGLQEHLKEGYGHIPVWPLALYLLLTVEPPAFLRSGATISLENLVIGLFFVCAGVYNHLLLTGSFQPMAKERG